MGDSDASGALARVQRAKRADQTALSVTGTKLLLFAIQLTLVGAFVGQLALLVFAAVPLGLLGLVVDG
ncbi:hypothetical protein ABSL23_12730 [Halobacterium sp. NMX12-1]|uniref:Sensor histidine kinase n=1 Tax=Halobacterium sp. NMX12-1 TaxID=3166650 RepID=A0AAU8CDG7_9EURY